MRTYLGSGAASCDEQSGRAAQPVLSSNFHNSVTEEPHVTRQMEQNGAPAGEAGVSQEEHMRVIQKTKMAAVIAALGMTVGLGTAVSAQPRGPAGGEHRGMRGGFPGLGQLGLSDDQRQEVRRIMELHKAERQAIFQRLGEARRAQSEAVVAVPVDEATVRARSAELAKVEADAAVLRARVHAEVYNVLTPEQQEKAKALRAEREARGAQHREGWKKGRQDRSATP
jgi:periplasmic protein CpxP/Spy